MQPVKAVVRNGRLVVDVPTELPEGTEVELVALSEQAMPAAEGARTYPLVGLMADEPDLMDQVCALAYQARDRARMRTLDD